MLVNNNPGLVARKVPNLNNIASKKDKMRKVAVEFETAMLSSLLQEMSKDVKMIGTEDGESNNETQEDFFKSILMNECAKKISNSGRGIGLANEVYSMMLNHNSKKVK